MDANGLGRIEPKTWQGVQPNQPAAGVHLHNLLGGRIVKLIKISIDARRCN